MCTTHLNDLQKKNIGYEFHQEGLFSEIIADYLHQFVQMKETVYRFYVGTKQLRLSYIPQPTFLKNRYLHCLFQIFCLPITLSQFELKIIKIKIITNPTIYSSACDMAGVKLSEVGLITKCYLPSTPFQAVQKLVGSNKIASVLPDFRVGIPRIICRKRIFQWPALAEKGYEHMARM